MIDRIGTPLTSLPSGTIVEVDGTAGTLTIPDEKVNQA